MFFAFLLVVLEKVIVWGKPWQGNAVKANDRILTYDNALGHHTEIAALHAAVGASVVDKHWLNGFEAKESSFLELEELSAVGGTTLGVDDKRRVLVTLTGSLPLFQKFIHLLSVFLA